MSKEFGRQGDQPHEYKKGGKYGEKMHVARGRTDSVPLEIFEKPIDENPCSPQSIFNKSIATLDALLGVGNEKSSAEALAEPRYASTLVILSKIDVLREDAQGVKEKAVQVERTINPSEDPEGVQLSRSKSAISLYLAAMSLGDQVSSERVKSLLDAEQENGKEKRLQKYLRDERYLPTVELPMLTEVIRYCADQEIPADIWIGDYALDSDHAAALKLAYYEQTKETIGEATEMGIQYLNEVTDQFLQGEAMSVDSQWHTSSSLLASHKEVNTKKDIIARFKVLHGEVPLTPDTQESFFTFAAEMLRFPDLLEEDDIEWIERAALRYSEVADDHDSFEVGIAHAKDTNPHTTLAKINEIYAANISTNESSHEEQSLDDVEKRDYELARYARSSAEKGKFEDAKLFLSEILHARYRTFVTLDCLEKVQTVADFQLIRPDELSLQIYEDLSTVYAVKEAVLTDPVAVREFARFFARQLSIEGWNESTELTMNLMDQCLDATYERNELSGAALASEMLTLFIERDAEPWLITSVAEKKVEQGDIKGLDLLYEMALREKNPVRQAHELAEVALLAYKASIDNDGSIE